MCPCNGPRSAAVAAVAAWFPRRAAPQRTSLRAVARTLGPCRRACAGAASVLSAPKLPRAAELTASENWNRSENAAALPRHCLGWAGLGWAGLGWAGWAGRALKFRNFHFWL